MIDPSPATSLVLVKAKILESLESFPADLEHQYVTDRAGTLPLLGLQIREQVAFDSGRTLSH
jgi:hypothetical protein